MKIMLVILCVLVAMLTGLASAQGDVYTTGGIYVASTPPGTTALLDGGAAYLYTPGTFTALPPGEHSVIFAKPGYQTMVRNVTVVIGETKNLIVTLDQAVATGSVSVSTTPRGAQLYIDGISQGKTDQIVGNLAPSPHLITLELAGFETWSQMVTVKSGVTTPVTATLVAEVNPATGDLRASSTPSGAAVYVNGDYEGTTPANELLDITNLKPGPVTVVMKKSGYQDYTTTATIVAGQLVQVFATLQPGAVPPTTATAEITSSPGGAHVFINNVFTGITPLTFQNVTPGTYAVEIQLDGYTPYTTTGQVVAGQNIRIAASLAPVATPTTTKAPVSPLLAVMALLGAGILAMRVSGRK